MGSPPCRHCRQGFQIIATTSSEEALEVVVVQRIRLIVTEIKLVKESFHGNLLLGRLGVSLLDVSLSSWLSAVQACRRRYWSRGHIDAQT